MAASGFADGIAARFEDYVRNRNYFYDLEARWPDAPFWRHRRERTALEDAQAVHGLTGFSVLTVTCGHLIRPGVWSKCLMK